MSYLLSILLVLLGFLKQNSKIIGILLLAFLWIMFGWNTGNADYANYERGYSWALGDLRFNSEVGVQLLYKLFIFAGLEYRHFLIIMSLIGLLLIYKTINRYTENVAIVFALYFIFPFIIDVVQIRNFLTMSIVLYATQFVIQDSKRGTLIFILLILLASSVHYSAIFYLFFLLIRIKDINLLSILSILLTIFGLVLVFTDAIKYVALLLYSSEKVEHWFSDHLNWGIIIALVIHALSFLLIYYTYNKIRAIKLKELQEADNNSQNTDLKFVETIYKINIILLLLFPLYVFNMIFFRLFRNVLILNYIAYSICMFNMKTRGKEKLLFVILVFLYSACLSIYYIVYSFYDSVFLPVFQNNSLIGL